MSFLQSIILGIIQGLTEFLPVSSSAHLVLIPYLFKWNIPESQVFPFDVLVQIGTLVAVIIYFWKDLLIILKAFFNGLVQRKPFEDPNARMGWYLILATIPAGLAGLLLKDRVEAAFNSPKLTAIFLFGTALLLLAAEFFSRRNRKAESVGWKDALWMGAFQAISIFPGISRSGATITGGMTRNLERPAAARFSFLMSIPVMAAAGLMSVVDLVKVPNLGAFLPKIALGFLAALLVGYLSIHWLLSFLNKHSLVYFAVYCVVLAVIVLIVSGVRASSPVAAPAVSPTVSATEAAVLLSPEIDPNLVTVEYTAALDWLAPKMSSCADTVSGTALVTNQVPASRSEPGEGALLLRWGEPEDFSGSVYQLGTDRLALVVNPENPLESLTPDLARQLFSGLVDTWGDAYKTCPACFNSAPGEVLAGEKPGLNFYLEENEIQALFERAVMGGSPIARASGLVIPSTLSMRRVVLESPSAIGFLPTGAADDTVKEVKLEGVEATSLSMPILAISAGAPEGQSILWLGCLQQAFGS